ncbi:MAG: hypothetical protein HXY23_06335 [Parvularculaceae bacterium]|nr:hypothetical protein [Parvularculaceae bacterium]
MAKGGGFSSEEIREESSWRYPLGIFLATLGLCAVFLYIYVGPSVDEVSGNAPSPSLNEEPVEFTVNGVPFRTPSNYTVYPRDRRGGERDEVWLYVLWPTLSGFTPARKDEFLENKKDTRRIDIMIKARKSAFDEQERIDVLYMPQVNDRRGAATPLQLVKYTFKDSRSNVPSNGYADTELFLGQTDGGRTMALFCFEDREDIRSPDCWREFELTDEITVIYRYKRRMLEEWKAIDSRVTAFVESQIARKS